MCAQDRIRLFCLEARMVALVGVALVTAAFSSAFRRRLMAGMAAGDCRTMPLFTATWDRIEAVRGR